jgi:aspartokinase-like uncharacterized kinase
MRARRPVTVVKLGGSLASSPHLRGWLDAVGRGAGRVVVVPGGGPFADAVRTAQGPIGFGDNAAHHMALLAMEQFGIALASLDARLERADSHTTISSVLGDRKVAIWSPTREVLAARDIPHAWEVTSDSLAAWLARKMRAPRLLLVKSVAPSADACLADDLAARGVVDPAFPRFLALCRETETSIAAADMHEAAGAAFARDASVGSRIVSSDGSPRTGAARLGAP